MNTPKCRTCRDTGHRDPSSFDLDCTDCDVAEQRTALNDFVKYAPRKSLYQADLHWAIHQRALAMAPKQEAATDDRDAWRAAGRAEALSILMGLCPETGIDEYTGWSTSGSPEDEGWAHWNEEKLRELLHVNSELADMMNKAESAYYDYQGHKDEADRAKAFAANMHNSGRVREVLAKAGEYDLIADLCRAAPAAANGAPELPRVEFRTDMHIDGKGQAAYSADQMRTYGQACALAANIGSKNSSSCAASAEVDALGAALQRAAGDLPDGYTIRVEVELGAGWVEWSGGDAEGAIDHDGLLADEVLQALADAKEHAAVAGSGA